MMGAAKSSTEEYQWWMGLDLNESYTFDYNEDEGDVCDLNPKFEAVFLPTLYSLAFLVGILGNGLLLGVLFQSRKSWSVTDTFILHLAVSDILLLITLPLWAAQAASSSGWQFGSNLCKTTGTVFTINFYSGIFLLACISIDRYLSIVHATHMYNRRKSWVVHMSCLLVWVFSLLLSIPDWLFLEVVSDDRRNIEQCTRNYSKFTSIPEEIQTQRMGARWLYHAVGFLLPSVVLIFCYSCILLQLQCGSQSLQKQRAFKVIIAVVGVFFLCWTPYNIVLLADTIQNNSTGISTCSSMASMGEALTVTASLGYLHCSLNPILYAFVGVKFRRQLVIILKSMSCKLKTRIKSESFTRKSSIWSDSRETSNSIAI